ncbi:diaminopimelate epimerase [Sphingomonas sp. ac-8]|uniref:diaminopimelate epimerase n=1 Tax=Sphingomonas sp. ac-8 TaxID=3242977 RepID=UPI003A7F9918
MQIEFVKCHGSGNDFPLVDARGLELHEDAWVRLARALADRAGPVGGDGLLLLTAGDATHAFGMRMFNPDGSEAETCLNGVRCTARLGFERLGVDAARVLLKTSDAEAQRQAELAPGVATIRTRVGPVSTRAVDVGLRIAEPEVIDAPIAGLPSDRAFTAVAMPNPHLVAFVDAVDEGELVALGDWCEGAPALLPARGNVSFVEVRGSEAAPALFVRTYERGVGLTNSCGSAMAASTYAAARTGRIPFDREARVFNRGGMVRASATPAAEVTIAGNATFEWDGRIGFDPATGALDGLTVIAQRPAEVASWDAMLASL